MDHNTGLLAYFAVYEHEQKSLKPVKHHSKAFKMALPALFMAAIILLFFGITLVLNGVAYYNM